MGKGQSGGVHFIRGILLFLNILFVIVGLALIGIGVYIKVADNFASILDQFTELVGFDAQVLGFLAFVMIGGGILTLLIALFGCVGTLWNSRCSLNTYAVILAIFMIIELVGFIMAFAFKSRLREVYEPPLLKVLDTGLKDNNTKILNAFHQLEKSMKCCGVRNISDYGPYNYTDFSESCKQIPVPQGCSQAIIDFLNNNLPKIGISLGVLLALEVFGLLAAIALSVALKHSSDDEYSSNPKEVIRYIVPGGGGGRRRNYN